MHSGPNYTPGKWAETEAIYDRSDCLVACAASAPKVILGFVVFERGPIVHYVYVREMNRRDGIAKQLITPLLAQKKVRYSHLPARHAVIHGKLVVIPKKHGALPPLLPVPSSWVYDPFCRFLGNYEVS